MTTALLIALCVMAAGFFAGAETGAYRLNRIRLHGDAESGSRTARLTENVVADMERFICMILTANNVAIYGATVFGTSLVAGYVRSELMAEVISTVTLAPVLLLFAEVIPKSLFQVLADPLMRWSSPLLWLTDKLLRPVVALLLALVTFWRRLLGVQSGSRQTAVTEQYLSSLLAAGTQEGLLTAQQDVIVRNILELRVRPVREIMTPMSHVQMLRIDMDARQARQEIARFTHARIPVYEGNPSNVVGSLRILDVLCEGEERDLRQLLRKPLFLDAETGVDAAFRRLQETGQTMAVVVDADQHAIGVLTMDDLLQGLFSTLGAY
jgi:CBS domain containing-hemolysin-like protein